MNPVQSTTTRAKAAVSSASGTVNRDDGAADVTLQKGAEAMVGRVNDSDIAEFMNDTESEFAPQLKSLEPRDRISGILEGYGPQAEFTTKNNLTGLDETRLVNTWIIKSKQGSMRISILSSVQLDSKLPEFIGDEVSIVRGDDIKSRSNPAFKIANYMVKGPPVQGKVRAWGRKELPKPIIDVLPSGPAQPALLAGGEDQQA